MKKIFNYSGFATLASIFLLILCAINFYVPFWSIPEPMLHSIQPSHILNMLVSLIWLIFFGMIIFCSEKDSMIKIAAIPGLISAIMGIIVASTILYYIYDLTSNYQFIETFFKYYGIIDIVFFLVSIVLIGVFLHNKLVLTAAICNVIFLTTRVLLGKFIPELLMENDLSLDEAYDIWNHSIAEFSLMILVIGSRVLYLYAFYRMGKQIKNNQSINSHPEIKS